MRLTYRRCIRFRNARDRAGTRTFAYRLRWGWGPCAVLFIFLVRLYCFVFHMEYRRSLCKWGKLSSPQAPTCVIFIVHVAFIASAIKVEIW